MIALLLALALQEVAASPYLGPKIEEPTFQTAFNAAIATCGLQPAAVGRQVSSVTVEPSTSGEKAALEQRVKELAVESGAQGSEANNRATYAFIRGLLKTRTLVRYTLHGTPQQSECVEVWLNNQGFTPLSPDQPLPPELSK